MIDGTLIVTPEALQQKAQTFRSIALQVKALHDDMIQSINATTASYEGENADSYRARFLALQNSMDTINRMIMEHSTDLEEMALRYMDADGIVASQIDALPPSEL